MTLQAKINEINYLNSEMKEDLVIITKNLQNEQSINEVTTNKLVEMNEKYSNIEKSLIICNNSKVKLIKQLNNKDKQIESCNERLYQLNELYSKILDSAYIPENIKDKLNSTIKNNINSNIQSFENSKCKQYD